MAKNLNIHPYYDDFDTSKNFHQILFKPGYAVQSRELTQIQSILKNQIGQFGNHVFKHGSVVIPGNTHSDQYASYIKISGLLGETLSLSTFNNQVIVGETSGVRAIVNFSVDKNGTDPYVFYVVYVSGGNNGNITFNLGETVHLELDTSKRVSISSDLDGIGFGTLAHINAGVYYVNETFVHVDRQTTVVDKFSSNPSARVMLRIDESFVGALEDETLLDPAQGSYNYAAPGADRLNITLTLITVPLDAIESDDYIELMRFREGVLEEHSRYPKYNELEKSLARRIYDESGDYVVSGLKLIARENKKTSNNNGDSITGDASKITYQLSPGKAYFRGFEIEAIASQKVVVDKARTSKHVFQTSTTTKPTYGQYLLVSNPSGRLNTDTRETIQLWNNSSSSGGTQIGTAKAVAVDYYTGDGVNPIFKIFFTDIVLTSGSFEDIGSIRTTTPFHGRVVAECAAYVTSGSFAVGEIVNFNSTVRSATVALYSQLEGKLFFHKHDSSKTSPKVGDLIVGATGGSTVVIQTKIMIRSNGQSSAVFALSSTATKSLKNATNAYDMTYQAHRKLTIAQGATSATISGGKFVPIETGTFVALSNSGADSNSNYSIDGTGTVVTRSSPAPAGGITIYAQSNNIGTPRTKTIQTSTPMVKSSTSVITLDHADVFEIISIVSGGTDIKSYYTLDSGATDYEYDLSKIRLNDGITLPIGNVTIVYRYFNHTAGDFFSVDSYSGIVIDEIPTYVSPSTGIRYSLRDCIDFRKTVGIASNIVVSDTIIQTSVQRYVPRIDSVCIDKQNKMVVLSGTPSDTPKRITIPDGLYELEQVTIPAYTFSMRDLRQKRIASKSYTMESIGKIETRIDRLEEYTTLTAQEAILLKLEVIDAKTGLDRYKTGYIVEDMVNPFAIANAFSSDFKSTMNPTNGILPLLEPTSIDLKFSSTSARNTGGIYTLPYTEKRFASVLVSSRTTNLNPFLLVKWNGRMVMTPGSDIWVEVIDLPEIIIDIEERVEVEVRVPAPPPFFGAVEILPTTPFIPPGNGPSLPMQMTGWWGWQQGDPVPAGMIWDWADGAAARAAAFQAGAFWQS